MSSQPKKRQKLTGSSTEFLKIDNFFKPVRSNASMKAQHSPIKSDDSKLGQHGAVTQEKSEHESEADREFNADRKEMVSKQSRARTASRESNVLVAKRKPVQHVLSAGETCSDTSGIEPENVSENQDLSISGIDDPPTTEDDMDVDVDAELEACLVDQNLDRIGRSLKNDPKRPRRSVRLQAVEHQQFEESLDTAILAPLLSSAAAKKNSKLSIADVVRKRNMQNQLLMDIESLKQSSLMLSQDSVPESEETTVDDDEMKEVIEKSEMLLRKASDDIEGQEEGMTFFSGHQTSMPIDLVVREFLDEADSSEHPAVMHLRAILKHPAVEATYKTGSWLPTPKFLLLLCQSTRCPASVTRFLFHLCAYGNGTESMGAPVRAYRCLQVLIAGGELNDSINSLEDNTSGDFSDRQDPLCEQFLSTELLLKVFEHSGAMLDGCVKKSLSRAHEGLNYGDPDHDLSYNLYLIFQIFHQCCRKQLLLPSTDSVEANYADVDALVELSVKALACPVGQKLVGCLPSLVVRELLECFPEPVWEQHCRSLAGRLAVITPVLDQQGEIVSALFATHSNRLEELRTIISLVYLRMWIKGPANLPVPATDGSPLPCSPRGILEEMVDHVKGIQKLPEDTNLRWISYIVFFAKLCRVEHVSMDLYPLLIRSMQNLKSSLSKFADTDAYQARIRITTLLAVLDILTINENENKRSSGKQASIIDALPRDD
eukprot:CAMPEP_0184742928 /NCGR_PEP_ID=MMETSP0315-20130426/5869_1 /TAXON_ID=101924 /ORGANISM="Rhodosorus marinus, Strain UTEX LB 2760" /LENGTH=714 /DNA_ID=CAMNT_0027214007 /DNA_START=297 /DNA_END=2441 /DNA_ORIENTATION=+